MPIYLQDSKSGDVLTRRCQAVPCSGRGSIVVVQHATQTLTPLNRSCVFEVVTLRLDEAVSQALVIAFIVIVGR